MSSEAVGSSFAVQLQQLPIDIAGSVSYRGSGQYAASYQSTVAGDYSLVVKTAATILSKYDVKLAPGAKDLSKFSAGSGVSTLCEAGWASMMLVPDRGWEGWDVASANVTYDCEARGTCRSPQAQPLNLKHYDKPRAVPKVAGGCRARSSSSFAGAQVQYVTLKPKP